MREPKGQHIPHQHLELLSNIKVTRDGGSVRYLEGRRYGLPTSVFVSEIVPGSGPARHVHPYIEVFVVTDGQGRYTVGEDPVDAQVGDVVIVPSGAEHQFVNTGSGNLRHVAIHHAPAQQSTSVEPDGGL